MLFHYKIPVWFLPALPALAWGSWEEQKVTVHSELSSCLFSWSPLLPQYHSKVSCFMLQHIEEPCSLGAHAAVVVPPTWILRVRRPQVTHLSSCGSFTIPACPAAPRGVLWFVSFLSRIRLNLVRRRRGHHSSGNPAKRGLR